MRKSITIGSTRVGPDQPLFIMAETGVTCNYDMKIARELIDVVSETGANAIKFIFWFPDEIMSDRSITYTYETVNGTKSENMFEMLNHLRFSFEQWMEIKRYADQKNVIMFATVNSPTGVDWAEQLNLAAYKLSSWDFNYHPLWKRIAAIGKPMLIDTGPVNTLDVAKVIKLMTDAGNEQSILIHCYHTDKAAEINMRSIPYMAKTFDTLVGFSSKDRRNEMDIASVALGACVIEKRLTMSRSLPGHHHVLSLEPGEFRDYVRVIRDVQASLGVLDLRPSAADLAERKKWFRRLVAARNLPKGTKLTADALEGKRPEDGISPEHLELFIGRELKRDLPYNEPIRWDDV